MDAKIFLAYCSPAGTTKTVAQMIQAGFEERGSAVVPLDLGKASNRPAFTEALAAAGQRACLWVGSPVYRDMTAPPVIKFIEELPALSGAWAVPFVTWGAACSGLALWQMAKALLAKGLRIAGAAKVLAQHSMMWRINDPPGKGHPDDSDQRHIDALVDALYTRLASKQVPPLDLASLFYQPQERAGEIIKKIEAPWENVPKRVDTDKCTQCGICLEECPAAAVALDPYPAINHNCFDCFNCIRLCPEDAIIPKVSMEQIENHIRSRVETIRERPLTQIFLC